MTENVLRRSQVVTTFGPGSLIDLPDWSVIVSGLEGWSLEGRQEIEEPRLKAKLRKALGVPDVRLFTPPRKRDRPTEPFTAINATIFPGWFVTQQPAAKSPPWPIRRRLVHWRAVKRGKYKDPDDNKSKKVVPMRFVRACPRGHIDDIDWRVFVHEGGSGCSGTLWMEERGTSGDLSEILVGCDCGKTRPLSKLFLHEGKLGSCNGRRPWLGATATESCGKEYQLLVRTASNAYFPQIYSVISLPDSDEGLKEAVDKVWDDYLKTVDDLDDLRYQRKKLPVVTAALDGFSDDAVMDEIDRRRSAEAEEEEEDPVSIKAREFEVIACGREKIGKDEPESRFYAETVARTLWDPDGDPLLTPVSRLVLVHRLREVMAQFGFTRFEAMAPDITGEYSCDVERAAIALEPTWMPAVEHRGEGIFIQFDANKLDEWGSEQPVHDRALRLAEGFEAWRKQHPKSTRDFPGARYVVLHSLSHLLMTAIALECGYPTSSLRERVYALEPDMYGILIYTGSADAEGTLGGLVQTGRNIEQHLRAALDLGRLCSNDPVCSEHRPANPQEGRFLHGAACHGCLLIAETSCEQKNDFLDRALVIPTVTTADTAFF